VVRDFSARVMRGDRIGLIGSNGAGKTTLLRMLLGEVTPDQGDVRHGANVQIAYYDQQREQLDPERTVFDTVGEGNDTVTANGRTRHVHAYLRDFLFSGERARSPVKALSGGERNRLLLARLFTRPANVLILDEPTNDLDLETLDLLEEQLIEWPGTLLLVSHDRVFLDNVVTSTFVFEGDGRVQEFVGGYEDWVRQRQSRAPLQRGVSGGETAPLKGRPTNEAPLHPTSRAPLQRGLSRSETAPLQGRPTSSPQSTVPGPRSRTKLSYKEQRELEALPPRIEAIESEQRALAERIAGADFYKESADAIKASLARVEELQCELTGAYARWDDLDSRR